MIFLPIFLFLALVSAREFQKTFSFTIFKSSRGWSFLDKMVLSEGVTQFKLQTQKKIGSPFGGNGQVVLHIIPQENWKDQQIRKCEDIIKGPMFAHSLPLDGTVSVSEYTLNVQSDKLYYFVLKDCRNRYLSQYSNQNMQIQLKLTIINNGSHLGEQENHWYIIPLIITVGMWLVMANKDYMKLAPGQQDIDYAKMGLFCAIATNISSLIWKGFGFLIYSYFGVDYLLFHLIYLFMHAISETMVITLLMLIAFGWSLNYLNGKHFELAGPAFGFIAMMNIMMTLMTQFNNKDHDRHHVFDTISGTLLIMERLTIAFLFFVAVIYTYTHSRYRIKQYLKTFSILGGFYICGMPIVVLLANQYIPQSQRNEFVFIFVETLKSICNISLTYMVSSSKSQYNKLSYRNTSFLPENTAMF